MRHILVITAILGAVATTGFAQPYAVSWVDRSNPDLPCEHCDPSDALGPPDATNVPVAGYYSLGGLGWVELQLGAPVMDIPGADLVVWEEITAAWNGIPGSVGNLPDETADVLLGFNADSWTWVGRVEDGFRDSMFIDIAGTGMAGATFVRIEDVSDQTGYPASPGFDLDAVEILPEPSTVMLLAAGGLLAMRSRRQTA